MTDQPTLIAIDASALATLTAEIRAVRQLLEHAHITPPDPWLTMDQITKKMNCTAETIRRRARLGEILSKGTGKARRFMLR